MRDLTLPLAIFAFVIIIADIILALTLCLSLPYHASRINYYPPYNSVVDIDAATIYCPCLHKYLDEFRGIYNVKFIKFKKNATVVKEKTIKEDPIKLFPYVVSIQTTPPYPKYVCDGYIENRGYIAVSHHCSPTASAMVNMTVRIGSSYLDRFGHLHQVVKAHVATVHGPGKPDPNNPPVSLYLYLLTVRPALTPKEASTGIDVRSMKIPEPLPLNEQVLFLHTWDVHDNDTTDVFRTVYYRPINKCNQIKVHYCFRNQFFFNYSRHVLLDPCKKIPVGLKYDHMEGMRMDEYAQDCRPFYMGSCMQPDEERKYCG